MEVDGQLEWFTQHTTGAPAALRARAQLHFERVLGGALPARLAAAGEAALQAAIDAGEDRAAALDLLAADALITLSLLATAEADPGKLAERARALRTSAMVAT